MRGKTNATNGVHLNATAVNKTVKSGQITAGDFVEYYTPATYIEQSASVSFCFCIGHYAIAKVSGFIAAFKDGQQIATYTGLTCSYIAKVDDFIVAYDNNQGVIGVLSLSNEEFTLVDTLTVATGQLCVGGGSGKLATIKRVSSSEAIIGIADISSSGELSNYQTTSVSKNITSKCLIEEYAGDLYLLASGIGSCKIIIDENNNVTLDTPISFSFMWHDTFKEVYKSENVVVIAFNKGSSSYYGGHITILDFVSGSSSEFSPPKYGEIVTCINDGYFLATTKIDYVGYVRPVWSNSTAIQYYANELILYSFDEETFEVAEVDRITITDDYTVLKSTQPGDIYYDMYQTGKCAEGMILDTVIYAQIKKQMKVTVGSGGTVQSSAQVTTYNISLYEILDATQLQEMSQKDYVIPYAAGHPIGVAQTDGNVNDVIPIYVPTASV